MAEFVCSVSMSLDGSIAGPDGMDLLDAAATRRSRRSPPSAATMSAMPLVTRPYDDADAEELTGLLHRAYAELGAQGLNFTAVDQDVEVTRERAGGGGSWVTTRDGRIVGALSINYPPDNTVQDICEQARMAGRSWLHQFAVDPTCRGTGLARSLFTVGRTWAADAGATHHGLDTATPAEHLTAMYRRWGFREVETIQFPGKTYPSTVMLLELADSPDSPDGAN